jgi:hypothetical protein
MKVRNKNMYALMDDMWNIYSLHSDMRVALMEMRESPFILTLINNVTGEVLAFNGDWEWSW